MPDYQLVGTLSVLQHEETLLIGEKCFLPMLYKTVYPPQGGKLVTIALNL
jgi:hypothetical protein